MSSTKHASLLLKSVSEKFYGISLSIADAASMSLVQSITHMKRKYARAQLTFLAQKKKIGSKKWNFYHRRHFHTFLPLSI
jgi:hypothetical protein